MASNHEGPEDDAIGSCLECAACLDLARPIDGRGHSTTMQSTKLERDQLAIRHRPPCERFLVMGSWPPTAKQLLECEREPNGRRPATGGWRSGITITIRR